jgi:hypothetical protein
VHCTSEARRISFPFLSFSPPPPQARVPARAISQSVNQSVVHCCAAVHYLRCRCAPPTTNTTNVHTWPHCPYSYKAPQDNICCKTLRCRAALPEVSSCSFLVIAASRKSASRCFCRRLGRYTSDCLRLHNKSRQPPIRRRILFPASSLPVPDPWKSVQPAVNASLQDFGSQLASPYPKPTLKPGVRPSRETSRHHVQHRRRRCLSDNH